MKAPEIKADEGERLTALKVLNILETPEEERFDRITRLAKRMFDVPIALISLVDEDRLWFKSCNGMDSREAPRTHSFCSQAISGARPLVVKDAKEDKRFAAHPWVDGPAKIRFYAGVPLTAVNGHKVGTLCILDKWTHDLSEADLLALRDLAKLAEQELRSMQIGTLDELTGITNRNGFVTLAQKSLDICARQGVRASMAFFDLEGFTAVNSQFGESEGDEALKVFARIMQKSFRNSDVFARLGGDQFVVLLTDTSYDIAEYVIARFRRTVDAYNEQAKRGYELRFCDGVLAVNHSQDRWVEGVLKRAGALMREKKRLRATP